jgi:SAM-dependent methyltransferase
MKGAPPRIFDRAALARARSRAERMQHDMFLVGEAADGIVARIAPLNQKFSRALDIEPFGAAQDALHAFAPTWTTTAINADEELATAETDFDLAVSVLGLQSVSDLPGILIQTRRRLKPDGAFAAALFGGATLSELRESLAAAEIEETDGASPRISPFGDVRDMGDLLQRAGFALPVADVERTTVLYSDLSRLFEDLRGHAQSNVLLARQAKPISRKVLAAATAFYAAHYAEPDGRLRATFDIIYMTGFAPAESQPKPLKPGSARHRLADALGAKEISAGESVALPKKDQT